MTNPTQPSDPGRRDPVFLNARRESLIILAVWATCLIWTVGYSKLAGYSLPSDPVPKTLGIPSWAFFGVFLPWSLATVFNIVFSLGIMTDQDLGEKGGGEAPSAPVSRPAEPPDA